MPRFDDDPPGIPLEDVGRLGQTWFIDTNIIGDQSEAARRLLGLRSEGWLRLVKADMLDTELAQDENPERKARLGGEAAGFEELLGTLVLDHSRLGYAVVGNEPDQRRLEGVFSVMFPNRARDRASSNDVRDALHVATALRYGTDGFIPRQGILRSAAAVRDAYGCFKIMSPELAVPGQDVGDGLT